MPCLDEDDVVRFFSGERSREEADVIEAHIDECAACRAVCFALAEALPRAPSGEPETEALPVLGGRYELLRKLGEGGMGAVFEARHRGTGRRVAVKVVDEDLARDPKILARFERETMATGAIRSQHIAHAVDAGIDATMGPYLVMDLFAGEDLHEAVRRLGTFPPDVAMRVAAQACLGLQGAHEAGVVHRDIKPSNLFLARREGSEVVVKVLDFGLAKLKMDHVRDRNVESTRTGLLLGSPQYMSPEQARANKTADHRTDLWSLGVVLYELLTGKTPHPDAETVGEMIFQVTTQPPRRVQESAPWVPADVAAIVDKALAVDPAARYSSAAEMHEAICRLLPEGHELDASMLQPLVPSTPGPVPPSPASEPVSLVADGPRMPLRASRIAAAAAAILAVAGSSALAWRISGGHPMQQNFPAALSGPPSARGATAVLSAEAPAPPEASATLVAPAPSPLPVASRPTAPARPRPPVASSGTAGPIDRGLFNRY